MKLAGFNLTEKDSQIVLDFVMPYVLSGIFRVSFYGRGPVIDIAKRDPVLIWDNMADWEPTHNSLVAPRQVHGTTVICADRTHALPHRLEADGVYLDRDSNAGVSLRFADCAPVVIACAGEEPWMLALHSGFAGTVKNICGTALKEAFKKNAISNINQIYAWIAPSICSKCYSRKKDDPLTIKGMESFADTNFSVIGDYVYLNINGEIQRQLAECGVSSENIFTSGFCTICDNDKFYSYRAGDLDADRRNFLFAVNTTKSNFK